MKKLVLLLAFIFSMTIASAVEYRSVGSNAEFCVYTFDGENFLILSFKDDDDNRLSNYTIVKFKLLDGTVIRLEGSDGSTKVSTSAVNCGLGIVTGSSSEKHFAVVRITQEEIEMLAKGVDKVAINTLPEVYKRSKWSGKEIFGQKLYDDFKNLANEFDE
jgi:hypothetical protein